MVPTSSCCGEQELMLSTFCIEHLYMKYLRTEKGGMLVRLSMTMDQGSRIQFKC